MYNWAHQGLTGGGGVAGDGSGERRRRDRSGAATSARNPVRGGVMRGNTWSWEVHWNQGEVLKGLAGGGRWLRVVLTAAEVRARVGRNGVLLL
jgi:hypothetical protein